MIILGIDPGTATTGFAVIKKSKNLKNPEVVDFGCISTDKHSSPGERLCGIYDQVNKLIITHRPNFISVESLYFFKNLKTVMPVSQAKGVILMAAAKNDVPAIEFTPLQVKMTVVGYGRAEKKQVQEMTKRLLDLSDFDLKKEGRKRDDAFDALGIALCAFLVRKNL